MNRQPNYYFAYWISVFCLKKLTYEKYIVEILVFLVDILVFLRFRVILSDLFNIII